MAKDKTAIEKTNLHGPKPIIMHMVSVVDFVTMFLSREVPWRFLLFEVLAVHHVIELIKGGQCFIMVFVDL